ncbi:hypothetical protein ACFC60_33675, partial [Kitasatospora purpeofusca]
MRSSWPAPRWGPEGGEGLDEIGGVGGAESGGQGGLGGAGAGGECGRGDPGGQESQIGGVVAGPGGDGAVGGPAVADGPDAFRAGAVPAGLRRVAGGGLEAQVPVLGGLAAGDTHG